MTGLLDPLRTLSSIGLALSLALAPLGAAEAAPPSSAEAASDEGERFAPAPPPLPEPAPAFTTEGPLRFTEGGSATAPAPAPVPEPAAPQEPPAIEIVDYAQAPSLTSSPNLAPQPRTVDAKRPRPGTGTMALGGLGLAASSVFFLTALGGPGWFDVEQDHALIMGTAALPTALIGAGLLVAGLESNKRYRSWTSRNAMHPPDTGNGLLVVGGALTLGFTGLTAYTARWAATKPIRERGDWAPMIVSGGLASLSAILLAGGAATRRKFDAWERTGYLAPGTLALRGGGGLTISGRF